MRPFNLGITRITRARSMGKQPLPEGFVWVHFRHGALVYDTKSGEWAGGIVAESFK